MCLNTLKTKFFLHCTMRHVIQWLLCSRNGAMAEYRASHNAGAMRNTGITGVLQVLQLNGAPDEIDRKPLLEE